MAHPSDAKQPQKINIWQLQQAKAHFSEVVVNAQNEGVQIITKNGVAVAVLLSKEEFDKLKQPKKSLLQFFKDAPCLNVELDVSRSKELLRDIEL